MIGPLRDFDKAITALRVGVANEQQWALIAGRVDAAMHLAQRGVLPGIQGHVSNARQALQAIRQRAALASGWQPTPLDLHEIDAVQIFAELHAIQDRQARSSGCRRASERRAAA